MRCLVIIFALIAATNCFNIVIGSPSYATSGNNSQVNSLLNDNVQGELNINPNPITTSNFGLRVYKSGGVNTNVTLNDTDETHRPSSRIWTNMKEKFSFSPLMQQNERRNAD